MKSNLTRYGSIGLTCLTLSLSGCERFLEIDPPKSAISKEVLFQDEETAEGALKGIYSTIGSGFTGLASGYVGSVTINGALSADELFFVNNFGLASPYEEINGNNITPQNSGMLQLWTNAYSVVYMANSLLEEVTEETGFAPGTAGRMRGEAYFLRAFTYFYLINLFGPLPLATGSDYRTNALLPLSPREAVYDQIITDLKTAEQLLSPEYAGTTRGTANKGAAQAMLARVYLYLENWEEAERYATLVIDQTDRYYLEDLQDVFLIGSREAIWQRLSDNIMGNASEATLFLANAQYTHGITEELLQAFAHHDRRRAEWVYLRNTETQLYVPYKYRATGIAEVVECSIVLRLAEQYLIRAEARAEQGNPTGALADLDAVRGRAGLDLLREADPALAGEALIDSIFAERQRELFTEWGHRWFDLKRSGRAVEVLSAIKPGFTAEDEWYPIPESEELRNPNLRK